MDHLSLFERAVWLGIGIAIGYFANIVVTYLRKIEEKVDAVDKHVLHEENEPRKRDERGRVNWNALALAAVLIIVAYSAFVAQKASNDVQASQDRLEHVTTCNSVFLGAFLAAVEPRTDSSQDQSEANAALQKSWYEFVQFQLHVPPYPEDQQRAKANEYVKSLKAFLKQAGVTKTEIDKNPYPTADQLRGCINERSKR